MSEPLNTTRHSPFVVARSSTAVLLPIGVLLLASCNEQRERPAPPTFPVTGKVVTNGGRLPVGGCVEFAAHGTNAEITATGVIDRDGNFSLSIPYVDRVIPGATEGAHHVRVLLPIDDGGGVVRIEEPFTIQPRENHFTITLPKRP